MRRHSAGVIAIALALGAIAGCSSARGASGDVVLGAVYPTRGSQAAGGTEELRGVQLAVEWANAHGGVRGRHIRLRVEHVGEAEEVPAAIEHLRAAHAVAIVGSHGSSFSAVAAAEVATKGPVFFETGAVGMLPSTGTPGRNFFRLSPTGERLGRAAIQFVGDALVPHRHITRPLRYAVVHVDDAYGRAVGGGARDEVRRRGLDLVADIAYDARTASFDAITTQLARARTDVVFVAAYLDDGVALRRALVAHHVRLVAAIGTSSSFCMPAFGARLGADAVGLFASDKPDADHVRVDALLPGAQAELRWAIATYRARYHEDMSSHALSGFSHGLAVTTAILPAATTLDTDGIRAAALRVRVPVDGLPNGDGVDIAPAGAIDAGQNRRAGSVIDQWVTPVAMPVVWPPQFATHAIADVEPRA